MMEIPDGCSRDGYIFDVDWISRVSIDGSQSLPVIKYGASLSMELVTKTGYLTPILHE